MADQSAVLDLIAKVYDAAYDQRRWPAFLESLRTQSGSSSAVLMGFDFDPDGQGGGFGELTYAPEVYRQYADYYWQLDEYAAALQRTGIRPGAVNLSHELIPDGQLAASEFGNDFLLPNDAFYFAGGINFAAGTKLVWCGTMRARRQGPPDEDARRLHQVLMPHVQQALRISARFGQLAAGRRVGGDLIDGLPYGLATLDRRGRVLATNRLAAAILTDHAGLRLDGRGVAGLRPDDDRRLQAAIAAATGPAPHATTLALARPDDARPLRVVVAPAPAADAPAQLLLPVPAVLLFLHDPAHLPEPPADLLRRLFGLTVREGQLALKLAAGSSLAEAAAELGIAVRTASSHLGRIFRKTGTSRQAELIRLLATLPPAAGFDGNG